MNKYIRIWSNLQQIWSLFAAICSNRGTSQLRSPSNFVCHTKLPLYTNFHALFRICSPQTLYPGTNPLAPNTHSLAPHCSLHLRAPLCSFFCSLARPFTRSRAHGKGVFVCESNASFSGSFNPLCAARLCVYVCVRLCVCLSQCACLHACVHACVSAPLCIHRTGRK